MGAGSAGLTLTAANTVYMLEPSHSLADEAQALSRAHRIGQTRPVRCVIFYTPNTIQERQLGEGARPYTSRLGLGTMSRCTRQHPYHHTDFSRLS
jgi:E3 ubiquitin-protein ligase SHPRH